MVEGLQRVVVTGLGAVTPIGNSVSDYWSGLTSGRNGVALISFSNQLAIFLSPQMAVPFR